MPMIDLDDMDELRQQWIDRLVSPRPEKVELQRFAGKVGRVITVNYSGKAIVDFADGAWYDIPASKEYLIVLAPDDPLRASYNPKANSAQPQPTRQG